MPPSKRQKRGKPNTARIENTVNSPSEQSDASAPKIPYGKKGRRLKKRQDFLSKLQAERDANKEKKAAKKRAETPVVKDLNPMILALEELDSTIRSVEEKPATKQDTNNNKPTKLKGRNLQKQILNEIFLMKSALGASSNDTLAETDEMN